MEKAYLFSMLVMFLLTSIVALRMLKLRYRAVREDGLNPAYFKLNHGEKLPDYLLKVSQQFENLFETPLLFYVIVIMSYVLQQVDAISTALAYAYVIVRIMHAFEHMGPNRVLRRRNIFLISMTILSAMWILAFARLLLS